jgi:hypothetical protein
MKRISTATRVLNKFGAGKDGYTDGDVIGGVPATDLEAALFDHLQEELAYIDPNDRTQVWKAIQSLTQTVGGFRNKFANGAFRTNQRTYVSGTSLATGVPSSGVGYGHDGFRGGAGGLTYTFVQSLGPTQITITAGTGIMAAEAADIEGGAYVLSWSGSAQGRVGINGAAPAGVYVASPILIPAAAAGQQITAEFGIGTLGTVQLERGSQTNIEWPPAPLQLLRCQRYLPAIGPTSAGVNGVIATGQCTSTTTAVFPMAVRTTPRVPPTGLIAVNPLNFQAANATYVGATTSTIGLYGTTSNFGIGILVTTAGAALVAGNASILVSAAAGGLLLFTGAEI